MRIRAIGTGGAYCRHPLIPPAFLIQTEDANVLVGCPHQLPAKLEAINLSCDRVDMLILLGIKTHQVGGLEEFARRGEAAGKKTMLVAPASLIELLKKRLLGVLPQPLEHYFEVRATQKVTVHEDEHFSDTLRFLPMAAPDYSKSFGLLLEDSKVLITGETAADHSSLHDDNVEMILLDGLYDVAGASSVIDQAHAGLPIYVQQKIWIYGYPDNYGELVDPLPMLFLPQGACVYDSKRKGRYFDKERFLRESAKRKQGNALGG